MRTSRRSTAIRTRFRGKDEDETAKGQPQQVKAEIEESAEEKVSSIAVVPLAIPITVGPGTTAALILFGAEASNGKLQKYFTGAAALFLATLMLTCILFVATGIERRLGKRVIMILSKITGLVLAALASQLIFDGVGSILAKYLK